MKIEEGNSPEESIATPVSYPMLTSFNLPSRGGGLGGRSSSRTVLITGVSKGLGRALALEMAKRGHTVIGCSRSTDKLSALQSDLSDPKHLFMNLDVVSCPRFFSPSPQFPLLVLIRIDFLELRLF